VASSVLTAAAGGLDTRAAVAGFGPSASAGGSDPWSRAPAPQALPNIVFILIDDLGWRDLGFMGSEYYETPNIDRLAAEAMVFTSAYANGPNCAPSRASLMSGQYTPRHGIYTVTPSNRGDPKERKFQVRETETELDLGIVTIAEALRGRGYATASMGKWHLGGEGHLPTDQGFDLNVGGDEAGSPQSYFWPYERERGEGNVVRIPGLQETGGEGEYLTDRLTDEALRWMEATAGEPFFLYLTHYAVHTPLQAKPELERKYRGKPVWSGHDNPRYAAMVESVDDSVGRVLGKLEELGIADNTVVIFFSDNGGLGTVTSMAPLRGSKGMLYEGGIREPLIVRWPGHTRPGSISRVPVIGTDFYPSLLEISGARGPRQPLDGISIVPLLQGKPTPLEFTDRPLFWHFPAYLEAGQMIGPWRTTPAGAVRLGDYKLLEFFEDGHLELYDLSRDVGEESDLSAAMPEKTAELHALMVQWRETVDAYVPSELNPEYDPGRSQR
jgi:arylsulfatase A-like enzyme